MNALDTRDSVFVDLHSNVLKPLGFRKRGHRSILNHGPSFLTVYLRASRWSSKAEATFWIDVQVFRIDWFALLWGPKPFPGPTEGTPSLVSEELSRMLSPSMHALVINTATDAREMAESLCDAMITKAWPLLHGCSTLEGILSYYESRKITDDSALSAAAVCILLGREEKAKQLVEIAKECAPHSNALQFIEFRAKAMWANSLKL